MSIPLNKILCLDGEGPPQKPQYVCTQLCYGMMDSTTIDDIVNLKAPFDAEDLKVLKSAILEAEAVVGYGKGKPDVQYLKAMFGNDVLQLGLDDKFWDLQLGLIEKVYSRDISDTTHVYLNPLALPLVHYYELEADSRPVAIPDWLNNKQDKCPLDVCQAINLFADLRC
eukprot:CAMPEP_0184651362 /NCGR_PEP_ID=MMETSP0308-20130426/8954_1 /TAXON_ID=38269 /ORGANISM="Gloeochaete witrockiana, Strain SAG 46.84" /LENGTH=168 /DNA_ID=CAMNT_0027085511 /DNA_START=267 /DNA_END=773 /DNA_ORIENTATION=+